MEFELSLVIPVYNDINRIATLLKKIDLLPFSKNIEIVVVDNNSDDGTYRYDIYSPIKGFKKEIIKSFSYLNCIDFELWVALNIYIKKLSVFQLEIKTFLRDNNCIMGLVDMLKIILLILKFRFNFFIKGI